MDSDVRSSEKRMEDASGTMMSWDPWNSEKGGTLGTDEDDQLIR